MSQFGTLDVDLLGDMGVVNLGHWTFGGLHGLEDLLIKKEEAGFGKYLGLLVSLVALLLFFLGRHCGSYVWDTSLWETQLLL